MSDVLKNIQQNDPVNRICSSEYQHTFLSFCSLICLLKNKRLNLANIFLTLLQDDMCMQAFKDICEIETDFEAVKKFLEYDPQLHKSKYIKNYLESK